MWNVADSKVLRTARRLTNDWEKSWLETISWSFFCFWTIFAFFFAQVDWPHNSCFWWTSRNLRLQKPWWFIPSFWMVNFVNSSSSWWFFYQKFTPHFRHSDGQFMSNILQIPSEKTELKTQLDYLSSPRNSFAGHWPWNATHGHTRPVLVPNHRQPVLRRIEMRISRTQKNVAQVGNFFKILYPSYSRMIHDIIL